MGVTPEPRPSTGTGRRTQALRGPGAGGFTPAQSLAASNPCLNCGTNIQLAYCPECGQREIDPDPTLREFLHELAEEFLHWDGKLVTTFRTLLTKPGVLTMEYLGGRRVRYISPLRVYLTCSVLFFFLAAIAPARVVLDKFGQPVEQGLVQISQSTQKELAEIDSAAAKAPYVTRVWMTHFARAMSKPDELRHATTAAIPKAMFVLVPLFAALIGVVYRDRRRKYPQHLAFALHVHAALFVALSVMLLNRFMSSLTIAGVFQLLVAIPFAAYTVLATQAVYESRRGQSIWRLTLASTMYFVVFLFVITALFAIIVLSS
ncbi:MAG: DUF3667 domain-containing protein [Gemmatimonadota bacterium]